ncbi:MAG TPA: ATP-binding protein [Arachnia sp.]|nr:ATP-binding protein [Arachnia sp.]
MLDLDASEAAAETRTEIARVLEGLDGVIALEISDPLPDLDGSLLVDVARPTVSEQRSRWIESLGEASTALADRIVGQFDLSLRDIDQVVWVAGESSDAEALWRELRARGRARLEGLAQRIAPTATLEEVELPAEAKQLLTRIRDQARRRSTVYDEYGFRSKLARGLGIAVLFEGESGTGKTMAAEALANALELDLYRVDLASVVSKYIGETEKNLKRVFDAAEASSAILLFDEADAIFGKRSEVKDSHDRYANIEVGYLLQRMEAYEGLAILTTNLKSALDQAFLRRLRFIVNFPFPGRDQRRRIWARIFPALPKGGLQGIAKLDFDALAGPSLTGGQIRNIAVGGAFLAASDGGVIVMEHLRDAACDELRKNGRPFVASDFAGWVTPVRSHCDPRLVEEGAR